MDGMGQHGPQPRRKIVIPPDLRLPEKHRPWTKSAPKGGICSAFPSVSITVNPHRGSISLFGEEMNPKRKRIVRAATILFGLYVLCFFPLWLGGGYILTESGRVRQLFGIPTGIAAPDIADWQPLIGHCQPEYNWPGGRTSPRCDTIGWAYYPFWTQVRKSHPPIQLLTDGGGLVEQPKVPSGFRLHWLRGSELARVFEVP